MDTHEEEFSSSTEIRESGLGTRNRIFSHATCAVNEVNLLSQRYHSAFVVWVKYTQTGHSQPFCISRQGVVGQGEAWLLLSEELRKLTGLQPRGERRFLQRISTVYLESSLGRGTHGGPARYCPNIYSLTRKQTEQLSLGTGKFTGARDTNSVCKCELR